MLTSIIPPATQKLEDQASAWGSLGRIASLGMLASIMALEAMEVPGPRGRIAGVGDFFAFYTKQKSEN